MAFLRNPTNFEMNMARKLIILFIVFAEVINLQSQFYALSNKPQLSQQKSIYHMPIGESGYGVYTLNYANEFLQGGFSVERYDHELGFIEDRFIKVPRKNFILHVFVADSSIYWVSVLKKRRDGLQLILNKLSYSLEGEIETLALTNLEIKELNGDEIIVRNSAKHQFFNVCWMKKNRATTEINNLAFNNSGQIILRQKTSIEYPIQYISFSDFSIGDSTESCALMIVKKPRELFSLGNRQEFPFVVKFNSEKVSSFEPISENNQQNAVIAFLPSQQSWIISGTYGDDTKESEGIYQIIVPNYDSTFIFWETPFSEFQAKTLDGNLKSKRFRNPKNYTSRRIIGMDDSTSVLLLERYVEMRQLETYYINGIPQTATKILFNFNEIGVAVLNNMGGIDTVIRINKEQIASPNTSYLLGYGSFVCEKGIHLVYNADISKNNEVIDIVIRPDFDIEKHVLVNSDNFYNVVIPFDGKETDYCTFTVPLLRDKQWFWMQVNNPND